MPGVDLLATRLLLVGRVYLLVSPFVPPLTVSRAVIRQASSPRLHFEVHREGRDFDARGVGPRPVEGPALIVSAADRRAIVDERPARALVAAALVALALGRFGAVLGVRSPRGKRVAFASQRIRSPGDGRVPLGDGRVALRSSD